MNRVQGTAMLIIDDLQKNNDEISWEQIVEAIKSTGVPVKNWLRVRDVLQHFIYSGKLTRTNNLMVEVYTCHH